MPLLDDILAKHIRLIDYECITEGGERGAHRLVAFGRYAGIAGMIDYLRGLGERCLALGFSTPFLAVGAAYMYPNLERAYNALRECGAAIAEHGLPAELCPMITAFTGRGKVSKGAQEVHHLLPTKVLTVEELPAFHARARAALDSGDPAAMREFTHQLFAVEASSKHMVRRKHSEATPLPEPADLMAEESEMVHQLELQSPTGGPDSPLPEPVLDSDFDSAHYFANPGEYEPIFHVSVAPYVSNIVNCMYWESKYPRLLTDEQAAELAKANAWRLLGVCDISCDFQGSIEFLKVFTAIDDPYYVYNPITRAVHRGAPAMDEAGILFHAVDHLPSEVPADASQHFGDALMPFIPALVRSNPARPFDEQDDLPEELRGAVIAAHGELTPNFKYIARLRASDERASATRKLKRARAESFITFNMRGHLFDSGAINKLLDVVEESDASVNIMDITAGRTVDQPSTASLQLFAPMNADMAAILNTIRAVVATNGCEVDVGQHGAGHFSPAAETTLAQVGSASEKRSRPQVAPDLARLKRVPSGVPGAPGVQSVLLLGAGFVSGPAADYLMRRPGMHLTVAAFGKEAQKFTAGRPGIAAVSLNILEEAGKLDALVAQHDLVISLVPAPFHPIAAKAVLAHKKNMVTASYISPDMAALQAQAVEAGVCILNEVGLDPGIDHLGAVEMLDTIQAAGGKVLSFSSVCGGLPAPEAATNELGYKFSWSPRGVLTAAGNPAHWLQGGKDVRVPGNLLLASASPFSVAGNPAFSLEVLPNRDATPYADKYGIKAVPSIYRGTLRYRGYCALAHAFAAMGWLSQEPVPELTCEEPVDHSHGPARRNVLATSVGVSVEDAAGMSDAALFRAVVQHVNAARAAAVAELEAVGAPAAHAELTASDCAALQSLLRRLQFFDAATPLPRTSAGTALDSLTAVLSKCDDLQYADGERDMALMQHEVLAQYKDGAVKRHTASLIVYGNEHGTAMSRTVGITAGIGAALILDHRGGSSQPGVWAPVTKAWYQPMLSALAAEGIEMREHCEVLSAEAAAEAVAAAAGTA